MSKVQTIYANAKKDPKTTIFGLIGAFLMAIQQIVLMFDADSLTNPDWPTVGAFFSLAVAFFFSKDKTNGNKEEQPNS